MLLIFILIGITDTLSDALERPSVQRRTLFRFALATTALGTAPLLGGCSGGAERPSGTGNKAASSPAGGTLTLALAAGPTDNTDPGEVSGGPGAFAVIVNVFDPLVALINGKLTNQLARELTFAPDARSLTIDLETTARFSDGTPVRPADVLASLKHLAATSVVGAFYADLDLARSRVSGAHQVVLQFKRPRADFVDAALTMTSAVAKNGDFRAAIGSGPYRVARAQPGTGWRLEANPHHAGGRPAYPSAEIMVVNDAAARARMLASGQVQYASNLPAAQAKALDPAAFTPVASDPTAQQVYGFTLNTLNGPFADPRLRVAAKQTIDRQRLVDVVFSGLGTVGNDLNGKGLPDYDSSIAQRTQDVAAATAAFAAAGITELTCMAADVVPGALDSIELVRQQFEKVGVRLTVDRRDATSYYADPSAFTKAPMAFSYYLNRQVAGALPFSQGRSAPFNMSGFTTPELERLLAALTTTTGNAERAELYRKAQHLLWNEGGEVLWGYRQDSAAVSRTVHPGPSVQSAPLLGQFSPA